MYQEHDVVKTKTGEIVALVSSEKSGWFLAERIHGEERLFDLEKGEIELLVQRV